MDLSKDILSHKTLILESQKEVFDLIAPIFHVDILENLQDGTAYCLQNAYLGNQYEVHVNNIYPPAINPMKVHEYGHILFSHFRGTNIKRETIKKLLKINWSKISKYFDNALSPEKVVDWFASKLNNTLMDFEVNSKLFKKEEFDTFLYIMDDLIITYNKSLIDNFPNNEKYINNYKKIYERKIKNPDDHLVALCWPEDMGFPVGLDYEAYVVYAIKNIDKFIDEQAKQISKAISGSGDPSENSQSAPIPSNYIMNDSETKEVTVVEKPTTKNSNKGTENSDNYNGSQPGTAHKQGNPIKVGNSQEDLVDFIYKNAFVREKTKTRRDMLYFHNKGRTRYSNVLIGYNKYKRSFHKANVVVLIDVSYSVNKDSVEQTLGALQELRNDFIENNSHILSWDTDLVLDSYWMDMKVEYSGGGTSIAKGIDYAQQYIKKSEDKLFIISDFEDRLINWKAALNNIKGETYGIIVSSYKQEQEYLQKLKSKLNFSDMFNYMYS